MTRYLGPKTDAADLATQGDFTLTTKGDLLTRTTTALTRLEVGINGQVLVADSSTTAGLKWSAVEAATAAADADQLILATQVFG